MTHAESVTIYDDPFTRQRSEGEATVIRDILAGTYIWSDGKRYRERYCTVRFVGSREHTERWIYEDAPEVS